MNYTMLLFYSSWKWFYHFRCDKGHIPPYCRPDHGLVLPLYLSVSDTFAMNLFIAESKGGDVLAEGGVKREGLVLDQVGTKELAQDQVGIINHIL